MRSSLSDVPIVRAKHRAPIAERGRSAGAPADLAPMHRDGMSVCSIALNNDFGRGGLRSCAPRSWSRTQEKISRSASSRGRSGKRSLGRASRMRRWGQPQAGRRLAAYPSVRPGPSGVCAWPRAEAGCVFAGRRRLRSLERGRVPGGEKRAGVSGLPVV